MSGTKAGAAKAVQTIKNKDPEFFSKIGAIGGSATGVLKGFAANRELAREAGRKGGSVKKNKEIQ